MAKKNILYLITGLDVGGAETYLYRTVPELRSSFNVAVACLVGHGEISKKLERIGVQVYFLDLNRGLGFRGIARFFKVIRHFKPDILVTMLIHADLFGRFFGRLGGVRKIVCSKRGGLIRMVLFDRLSRFLVSHYIVQTEAAKKDLMLKLRERGDRITVIPNGIDLSDFAFSCDQEKKKSDLKIDPHNLNIVCVANLKPGKGHEDLILAFNNAWKKCDGKINLLLVGDGVLSDKLHQLVTKLESRKNVYFLGLRNDVREILRISDIFVLATKSEGMSNSILEAMSSSLPIITTDIPVNREVVQAAVTGLLVPVGDTSSLSEAICTLVQNPSTRKQYGEAGYVRIKSEYQSNDILNKTVKLYQEIMS